jgi:hypothetical protein
VEGGDAMSFPLIQNEQFDAMRVKLELWPEIPRLTEVHPLDIAVGINDEGTAELVALVVCCHDEANGGKHQLVYTREELQRIGIEDAAQIDTNARLLKHANLRLAATYN